MSECCSLEDFPLLLLVVAEVVVVGRTGLESLSDMAVISSPRLTLALERRVRFTAFALFTLVLFVITASAKAADLGLVFFLLLVSGPLLPESIFSWGSTFLLGRFLLPEEAVLLLSQLEEVFFRFAGGLWLSEFDDRVCLPVTFLSGLLTELLPILWRDFCLRGLLSRCFSLSKPSR